MFNDEFKERYTTIPFAIYQACCAIGTQEIITHYHREIELIAITEGSAEFYINSKRYLAKKGDILIIPPYALHRGSTTDNVLSSYDCICFDSQLLCDKNLDNGLESQTFSLIPNEAPCAKQLQEHIKRAVIACKENEIGWELEAVGNMSLLFGILKKNSFIPQSVENNKETLFGEKVMTFLLQNSSCHITSRDVANALYMSPSYFCRLFKRTFGYPFEKYLLIYRLEKSRLYLKNTTLPVTEIAFRSGFQNCSYFAKTFKERFHITPLSYRKMQN